MAGDPGVPHDHGVAEARARVEARREIEASDRVDTALADQQLLEEFGTADYESGRRVVQKYMSEASAAELEAIRNGAGGQPLNAAQWKVVARRAIGELPTTADGIDVELAQLRTRMREDPKGWYADDRAQLRYRRLLRAKEGAA